MLLVALLRIFTSFPMDVLTKRDQIVKASYIWMHHSLQNWQHNSFGWRAPWGLLGVTLYGYGSDTSIWQRKCAGVGKEYNTTIQHRASPAKPHTLAQASIQPKEGKLSLLGLPRGVPFSHKQKMGTKGLVHMISWFCLRHEAEFRDHHLVHLMCIIFH